MYIPLTKCVFVPAAAVTAKPSFLPPGALANYCEYYDKTNATETVWLLRRDMGFGSMSGVCPRGGCDSRHGSAVQSQRLLPPVGIVR